MNEELEQVLRDAEEAVMDKGEWRDLFRGTVRFRPS